MVRPDDVLSILIDSLDWKPGGVCTLGVSSSSDGGTVSYVSGRRPGGASNLAGSNPDRGWCDEIVWNHSLVFCSIFTGLFCKVVLLSCVSLTLGSANAVDVEGA